MQGAGSQSPSNAELLNGVAGSGIGGALQMQGGGGNYFHQRNQSQDVGGINNKAKSKIQARKRQMVI